MLKVKIKLDTYVHFGVNTARQVIASIARDAEESATLVHMQFCTMMLPTKPQLFQMSEMYFISRETIRLF